MRFTEVTGTFTPSVLADCVIFRTAVAPPPPMKVTAQVAAAADEVSVNVSVVGLATTTAAPQVLPIVNGWLSADPQPDCVALIT